MCQLRSIMRNSRRKMRAKKPPLGEHQVEILGDIAAAAFDPLEGRVDVDQDDDVDAPR